MRTITPARRQKTLDAAIAAIGKRHTRDGNDRTREHHGARVGDWTLVSTCGCTALLTRTSAPTIDRDSSSILSGTPRAAVALPDLTDPIKRCRPLAPERSKAVWIAADDDRVWTLAFNSEGEYGREWTPAPGAMAALPVSFDARYLLEAFRLLSPAGELVTWQAHDQWDDPKRPDRATLFASADGQWGYLAMPMTGDRRAALDLLPARAAALTVAA